MPDNPQTQQPQQPAKLHPVFERWLKERPNDFQFDEDNGRFIIKETGDTFMPTGEYIAPRNSSYQSVYDIASQYQRILDNDTIPAGSRSSGVFYWDGQPRSLYRSPNQSRAAQAAGIGEGGQYQDMNQAVETREAALTRENNEFAQTQQRAQQTREVPISQGQALGLLGGIAGVAGGGLYAAHKTGFGPWSLYQAETALTHMSPRKWAQWGGAFPKAEGMLKPQPYNLALDPSASYKGAWLFKGLEDRRGTNLQNYLKRQYPGVKLENVGTAPITGKHGFLRLRWGAENIPGAERFQAQMPQPKGAEKVVTEAVKETAEQATERAAQGAATTLGRTATQSGSLYSLNTGAKAGTAARQSVLLMNAPARGAGATAGRAAASAAASTVDDAAKAATMKNIGQRSARWLLGGAGMAATTFAQLMLSPQEAQGGMTPWASEAMYRQQENQLVGQFNGYVAEVMKAPTRSEMERRAMQLTRGNKEAARIITDEAVRQAQSSGRVFGTDRYESVLSPARR